MPNIWNSTMFGDVDWPPNASRRFVSISWASCSATRERRGVTEIGLYSESVLGLATLWTGVNTACRYCKGTVPQKKDKFRICATTWAIS